MKKSACIILAVLSLSTFAYAQGPDGSRPQGTNLDVPEGWSIRLDSPDPEMIVSSKPDSGDIYFVNMTPGWHITTGPRGIFYHEDNQAEGNYRLESTIYLFDTQGRDREAFGLFIGGQDLQGDGQQYLYFLLRNTGEYLVKKRMGDETETLQAWTETDVMNQFATGDESSARNDFALEVADGQITFSLNGEELTTLSADGLQTDGTYGFRVNHAINLHISSLRLTE